MLRQGLSADRADHQHHAGRRRPQWPMGGNRERRDHRCDQGNDRLVQRHAGDRLDRGDRRDSDDDDQRELSPPGQGDCEQYLERHRGGPGLNRRVGGQLDCRHDQYGGSQQHLASRGQPAPIHRPDATTGERRERQLTGWSYVNLNGPSSLSEFNPDGSSVQAADRRRDGQPRPSVWLTHSERTVS